MGTSSFAKAFAKVADKAAKKGIDINLPPDKQEWETSPDNVPMMYRAQVGGRCSLQYAGRENQDLDAWRDQWIYPRQDEQPHYQKPRPVLGEENGTYRIEVEFPDRVFTNCGQDSIARPTLGKDGIPFLPGSSVKGLFRRACSKEQARQYCGDASDLDNFKPGSLRFHGAYPLGNWSDRIVDLVHPQQPRQVGKPNAKSASAFALISFYQPRFIFEFSSRDLNTDWREVEWVLLRSLQLGIGGKTSSGYGLGGNLPGKPRINPAAPVSILLQGQGVSSVLRDGAPEFRPNLFKASLRGHVQRLLGGVSNQEKAISSQVDDWFGKTDSPAMVKLLWQEREPILFQDVGLEHRNPTYKVSGLLYLDILKRKLPQADITFLQQVIQFAYTMGGFGKSWRRVCHKKFLPHYHENEKKFAIGCHWVSPDIDEIRTKQDLHQFLVQLHQTCCDRMNVRSAQAMNWREAWNPDRVAVYCSNPTQQSKVIRLFHDDIFKTTPAIGGKKPGDDHPTSTSSVWHRMLPGEGNQFLEIVTVFRGDLLAWECGSVSQLDRFIHNLQAEGLDLAWGNDPKSWLSVGRYRKQV